MDFGGACQKLNEWIVQSQGQPIILQSGFYASFKRIYLYTETEIGNFEEKWGLTLPQDYREFLKSVGAVECFISKYGMGLFFHRVEDLEEICSKVFFGFDNPFPKLILIVSLTYRGDEGGFDISRNVRGNFTVFDGEAPPEEWLEASVTPTNWCGFSEWFIKLVESEREIDLPN